MFAAWRDVGFTSKTFHITEKPDIGFGPRTARSKPYHCRTL